MIFDAAARNCPAAERRGGEVAVLYGDDYGCPRVALGVERRVGVSV
jgi:hypothetical protein